MKRINYIKIKSWRILDQAYGYCKFPSIHSTEAIRTPAICTWGVGIAGRRTYIAEKVWEYHAKN